LKQLVVFKEAPALVKQALRFGGFVGNPLPCASCHSATQEGVWQDRVLKYPRLQEYFQKLAFCAMYLQLLAAVGYV